MPVRMFSGNAKATVLTGAVTAASTALTVVDATGYPDGSTGPFVVTIDAGMASEEKVLVDTRTSNTFTVATDGRGYDGTTAADHANAATVQHTISAVDLREANAHVNDTSGDPHPQYRLAATAIAATGVTYAGSTDLVATNVEAALDELDAEKISTTAANAALAAKVDLSLVDAAGDLLVGSGADTLARLAKGADGTVLSVAAGAVGWAAPAASTKFATGSFTGDGAATRTVSVGFTPSYLVLARGSDAGSSIGGYWTSGPAGLASPASGSAIAKNTSTSVTSRPQIVDGGFQVGGSAEGDTNTTNRVLTYYAWS